MTNMKDEEAGLRAIRAKMSETQRRDMAEIIANELKSRQAAKRKGRMNPVRENKAKSSVGSAKISGGLNHDQVKELYQDVSGAVQKLRIGKIDKELSTVRRAKGGRKFEFGNPLAILPKLNFFSPDSSAKNVIIMYGIVLCGGFKILFSTGIVDAAVTKGADDELLSPAVLAATPDHSIAKAEPVISTEQQSNKSSLSAPQSVRVAPISSPAEKELLTQLDARRVELEERRSLLDKREAELKNQGQALSERLAELKSLTTKLSIVRKERDQRYEARLEQLANVYGSMAPNEAAPLVGRLEDEIALALLERMPGKRMGQILSLMDQERAVELTKSLTDKKNLSN